MYVDNIPGAIGFRKEGKREMTEFTMRAITCTGILHQIFGDFLFGPT